MDLKKFIKIFIIVLVSSIVLMVFFGIKGKIDKRNEERRIEEENQQQMEEYEEEINNLDFELIEILREENPDIDI
jgi:cell division protein FtsB